MPQTKYAIRRIALAFCLLSTAVGCVSGRKWNPFEPAAPPVFSASATAGEVVSHLNANIERCAGWQSHDVDVTSNGFGLSANATVAVESPRNFRMLVSAMGVDLADVGSNPERMWFWVNQGQSQPAQYVYTCAYADLNQAQDKIAIPFRPQWLMEVMGVMPIAPGSVTMRTAPGNEGLLLLESPLPPENGVELARRITVDAQTGLIVSHSLVRANSGEVLAEARLSEQQADPETGVVLPHRIQLRYPGMQFELTLDLDEIEVNPRKFAVATWQPTISDTFPMKDIVTDRIVTLDKAPGHTSVPWDGGTD